MLLMHRWKNSWPNNPWKFPAKFNRSTWGLGLGIVLLFLSHFVPVYLPYFEIFFTFIMIGDYVPNDGVVSKKRSLTLSPGKFK